jgi:hypothetical protein
MLLCDVGTRRRDEKNSFFCRMQSYCSVRKDLQNSKILIMAFYGKEGVATCTAVEVQGGRRSLGSVALPSCIDSGLRQRSFSPRPEAP